MNEEIVFNMGLDTSKFQQGLRSIKHIATETAHDIREKFNEMGKAMLAPFATIASVEGVKKILEFGESIERGAQIAGVSTDFYQSLGTAMRQTGGSAETGGKGLGKLTALLGEARAGNVAAIEQFARLNISLTDTTGAAKDTEQVFREVADKIHGAASAEERAQIATDAFGRKLGLELIPALMGGSAALDKFGDSASKLTEEDLKALKSLSQELDKSATTAQVWGGKIVSAFSEASKVIGTFTGETVKLNSFANVLGTLSLMTFRPGEFIGQGMQSLDKMMDNNVRERMDAEDAKKLAKEASAREGTLKQWDDIGNLLGELTTKEQQHAFEQMSNADQLNELTETKLRLNHQIDEAGESTADGLLLQIQREDLLVKIAEKKKQVDKEISLEKEKQARMQDQIKNATESKNEAAHSLAEAKAQRYQFTLSELAQAGNYGGQLGHDQELARQIMELERQGTYNKFHERMGDAKDRFDSADALRQQLSEYVTDKDRHPFAGLEKHAEKTAESLDKIIKGAPVVIVPNMGK